VPQFRREWRASLLLGGVSFAAPFLVTMAFAYWALDWSSDAAQIAGIALSTTSLAVVYAVLVEPGLNQTLIGKRIMSATFVTDFGTAAALSILFIKPNFWIVVFAAVSAVLIFGLPRLSPSFVGRYGNRVIEPEIKLVFASVFLLMWLGDKAHSHAVLPAFILGLALANHYATHRKEQERLRVVAFAFLTPLFFFKGGMSVSVSALWENLGVLALLFGAKLVPKLLGVYPLARRYCAPHGAFTTLLMSTGLTFGTISSLYGLQAGIIDEAQFSLLVATRRPLGDRPDRDRAALLPAFRGGGGPARTEGYDRQAPARAGGPLDALRENSGCNRRIGSIRPCLHRGARARLAGRPPDRSRGRGTPSRLRSHCRRGRGGAPREGRLLRAPPRSHARAGRESWGRARG